jgi:hypothetical protein
VVYVLRLYHGVFVAGMEVRRKRAAGTKNPLRGWKDRYGMESRPEVADPLGLNHQSGAGRSSSRHGRDGVQVAGSINADQSPSDDVHEEAR